MAFISKIMEHRWGGGRGESTSFSAGKKWKIFKCTNFLSIPLYHNFSVKRLVFYTFENGKEMKFMSSVVRLIIRDFTRVYSVLKIGHFSFKKCNEFQCNHYKMRISRTFFNSFHKRFVLSFVYRINKMHTNKETSKLKVKIPLKPAKMAKKNKQ